MTPAAQARCTSMDVVIGPQMDLHPGIHGGLLDAPPTGVSYTEMEATHSFLFAAGTGFPDVYESLHWAECVRFARDAPLVHAARWPVLGARAWVADMDDFGYPALLGRPSYSAHTRRRIARDLRAPGGLAADHPIRLRCAHMLRAYAHPSCRAILFRTRHALELAARTIADHGGGADGRAFLDKCHVVGPAVDPIPRAEALEKWEREAPMNVLFCGNDWAIKQGPLALRVFTRLATRHPRARFVYAGEPPPRDRDAPALPANVRVLGSVPRAQILALLRGAHVLFHPARSESFGMVLLEAAAAGCAIVCAAGRGMEHVSEIVDPRGAALVDRTSVAEHDEEHAFEAHLARLVADRRAARALGLANHDHVAVGIHATANRNARLSEVYREAIARPAPRGLAEVDVASGRPVEVVRLGAAQMREAEANCRRKPGCDAVSVRLELRGGAP